eukprot:jgi/Bigna1/79067/fgenesh1_pg.59_\
MQELRNRKHHVRFSGVEYKKIPLQPVMCTCDEDEDMAGLSSSPFLSCHKCMEWHSAKCLAIPLKPGAFIQKNHIQAVCLRCRKRSLLDKLYLSARKKALPPQCKLLSVCQKLQLPTTGTQRDLVARLASFLTFVKEELPSGSRLERDEAIQTCHEAFKILGLGSLYRSNRDIATCEYADKLDNVGGRAQKKLLRIIGVDKLRHMCQKIAGGETVGALDNAASSCRSQDSSREVEEEEEGKYLGDELLLDELVERAHRLLFFPTEKGQPLPTRYSRKVAAVPPSRAPLGAIDENETGVISHQEKELAGGDVPRGDRSLWGYQLMMHYRIFEDFSSCFWMKEKEAEGKRRSQRPSRRQERKKRSASSSSGNRSSGRTINNSIVNADESVAGGGGSSKLPFTVGRIRKMLKIFDAQHLRKECLSYGLPSAGTERQLLKSLGSHLYAMQPKGYKTRPHADACSCDLCDLELAVALNTIQINQKISKLHRLAAKQMYFVSERKKTVQVKATNPFRGDILPLCLHGATIMLKLW